jgi:ADP-ribosylglycohydrolase
MIPPLDRFRGALLGVAVGDALGRPLKEIDVVRRMRFKYGAEAPRRLSYSGAAPAAITDETQLTLFVAEGLQHHLATGQDRGDAVRDALLRWRRTQRGPGASAGETRLAREPRLQFKRLPEPFVELALDAVERGQPHGPGHPLNSSAGPTAMARSAPYGLALPTLEDAFDAAYRDATLTHGDPVAALGAATYASLVHGLSRGSNVADAIFATMTALQQVEGAGGPLATAVTSAHHLAAAGPPDAEQLGHLGDGRRADSALAIALACVMSLEAPSHYGVVRAMWRSVLHPGPSDTTGALTGGLLGAALGPAAFPDAWLIDLELIDVVEAAARDLHEAASASASN